MTNKEKVIQRLINSGIELNDAVAIRRISMTLNNWFCLECGTEYGYIERDETTNKPFIIREYKGKQYKYQIADKEKGAIIRLNKIMSKYPLLDFFIQTDPRGASLYILRQNDVPDGENKGSFYTNGIAVYK